MSKKNLLLGILLAVLLLACPVMAEKSEDEKELSEVRTESVESPRFSSEESDGEHPDRFGKDVPKHPRDGEKPSEPQKDSRREIRSSDAEDQPNPSGCSCRCDCGKGRHGSEENREGSPREDGRPAPEHHHHSKSGSRNNGSDRREQPPAKPEGGHSHRREQREYAF